MPLNSDLEEIKQPDNGNSTIDPKAKQERHTLTDLKKRRFESDTHDRKWLAVWSAIVVTLWLTSVIAILIKNYSCVKLSDAVLIALLGTTTLNVLGLSFIVIRGHFQSSEKE